MDIATHRPGSFCTTVLRTTNPDRASAFYGGLLAWTTQAVPGAPDHRLLQSGGKTVASLHRMSTGDDQWVPHASVESVERTVGDAIALGATLVDRSEVPGIARLATLRDPEGAAFGLWQPAPHQGAERMEEAGSLWWIEVVSRHVAGARDFYGRLFGWSTVDTAFEPFNAYVVFKRGDVSEGGILPMQEGWEFDPVWNSIVEVADCDAAIARGCELGGAEVFVHTVPKHGRIGSVADPGGAILVLRGPVSPSS
jgi:predicted enzyme related to lactoylglutathione lyase